MGEYAIRKRDGERIKPFHGLRLSNVHAPAEVEHGNIQMRHDNGYLVLLPCPESASYVDDPGLRAYSRRLVDNPAVGIALNGYGGSCELVQQRWIDGRLVPVLQCKGCGHAWRLPEIGDASALLEELHDNAVAKRADHRRSVQRGGVETLGDLDIANSYDEIAQRILDGYDLAESVLADVVDLAPW